MIRNIFIPEKIGNHYIFAKRIIGFDIGKTHVSATQLFLKGKTITIEKSIAIPLEAGTTNNYDERVVAALKIILAQVDPYDALHTSLSSSLAIFKELKLPFLDHAKIRMIIEFEVEPLLPFSIHDSVIDFIVTQQNTEDKSSEVLVAAVQKQHIIQHIDLFAQAGANPDLILIDLFALYGVYNLIPAYADAPGGTVLIDLGAQTTNIAYIYNGRLKLIRSLSKGVLTQAKAVSQALNIQVHEALESIIRFGLEKGASPSYMQAMTSTTQDFWQDISFTLNSFITQTQYKSERVTTILLLGGGAQIKGLAPFVAQQLGIPCELFQIHKILQSPSLSFSTKNGIPPTNVISFCTALPTPITTDFTLRRKEFSITTDRSLLNKQLLTAGILFVAIFLTLFLHSFLQLRALNNAAYQAEQEVITHLKEEFKGIPRDEEDLETVVQQANAEVQREQKLWFAFANPARVSFLHYLLELTSRIDKEALGFSIDRLLITENSITMTAHVKNHDALIELEKALREPKSKLFRHIEGQNTPDFTMKIRIA